MKRYILLALVSLQALLVSADVVRARIVDSENGDPLEGAKVQFFFSEVSGYRAWMINLTTDSLGMFQWHVGTMSRVQIEVNYFGYEPLKKYMNVAGGSKDTLNLGDLRLQMSEEMMKEVLVEANARRFTMKGDTVIFNPEAFHLEDGDRVAALLQKLPGVTIKEGKLYFMNKEVHLKMNGRDVSDQFLTGLLPAEAVQNIKAYEKKSQLAEVTGMNDGQEEQVLDIVVKPGFMDKWYGQTKVSAYASKNYRASANLHYLSDEHPVNAYVRASDCGSKTANVWNEHEYDWDNAVPQRQHYGKFSYRHNWKPEYVKGDFFDNWNIMTSPQHNDTYQNSWQNSETFLSGEPSSFSNSHNYDYNHNMDIPLDLGAFLHLGPKTWMNLDASGGFTRERSHGNSQQETYRGNRYSSDPLQPVNSSESWRQGNQDNGHFETQVYLNHAFERGDYYFNLMTNYSNWKGRSDSRSEYRYLELDSTETLCQTSQNSGNQFQLIFDTRVNYQVIEKKLKLGVAYWIDYWRKAENSVMHRNGVYDFANSYDRMKSYFVNEPRVEIEADLGKWFLHARVKLQNVDENMEYQRGKLDTVAHRNTWFPRPLFDFKWQASKATELKGSVDWEYHVAELIDCMAYTDDTNPLNITKGNPLLKPSSDLNTRLSYNMMFTKGQQMLSWELGYSRTFDPASRYSIYNAKTGGYISSVTNVGDRQRWYVSANYDRTIIEDLRMINYTRFTHLRDHGIRTLTAESAPMQQFLLSSASVYESLRLYYTKKTWEASAWGNFTYDGVSYSDPSINGQNLWDYTVGLSGKYKLKHWTFDLQGRLVGNAGYLSDMMNRNRFALDASVTWKMLKNKGQLTFTAKDILNQMDRTMHNITPTMRSESREETFHRYFSLTFTYNFDAKAKKKQK